MSNRGKTKLLKRSKNTRHNTRTLKIIQRYKKGIPVLTISEEFKISSRQVLRIVRLADIPKRPKSNLPDTTKQAVLTAYKQGKPVAAISRAYSVSPALVSKLATLHGINRYKRR